MPLASSPFTVPQTRRELALAPGDARLSRLGPNHHLWRNGRLWWIAFTVIDDGWRQERVRHSLKTADLAEARRRRDAILASLAYAGQPLADEYDALASQSA